MAVIVKIGKEMKVLKFRYGKKIMEEEAEGIDLTYLIEYYGFKNKKDE
ncbi:hypothetical protein ELBR111191_17960 [Elizabethkingia bruuniana]